LPPLFLDPEMRAAAILIAGTGLAAAIDLRTRRVPNALTASLALVGLGLSAAGLGHVGLVAALLGCVTGAALMLPGHVFGATGAGDVKLLAAAGALLGVRGTVYAFLYTANACGVIALAVAIRRRRLQRTLRGAASLVVRNGAPFTVDAAGENNRFAYAPAIAAGVVAVALGW